MLQRLQGFEIRMMSEHDYNMYSNTDTQNYINILYFMVLKSNKKCCIVRKKSTPKVTREN